MTGHATRRHQLTRELPDFRLVFGRRLECRPVKAEALGLRKELPSAFVYSLSLRRYQSKQFVRFDTSQPSGSYKYHSHAQGSPISHYIQ